MSLTRRGHPSAPRPEGDEGIALVVALVFVVLLAALVVDFTYEMQVEATLVESRETDFHAYLAAKSGIAAGLGLLSADVYVGEEQAAQAQSDTIYDGFDEEWAQGVPLAPLNEGIMQCYIDDEYGKINLNALIVVNDAGEEIVNERLREALRLVFEFRGEETDFDRIVDSLIDWLDTDDDTEPNGAEDDYYTGLETPFNCKNGPMDNLEELLLLPGVTPLVYFGDPEEEEIPLSDILTVHGHPRGRINVNTATYPTLVAILASDATGCYPDPVVMAQNTIEKLEQQGPFYELQELEDFGLVCRQQDQPGNQQGQQGQQNQQSQQGQANAQGQGIDPGTDIFEINSSVFRLHGDGQSAEARVRIEAFVWRDTAGIGQEQMFRIIDWRVVR